MSQTKKKKQTKTTRAKQPSDRDALRRRFSEFLMQGTALAYDVRKLSPDAGPLSDAIVLAVKTLNDAKAPLMAPEDLAVFRKIEDESLFRRLVLKLGSPKAELLVADVKRRLNALVDHDLDS